MECVKTDTETLVKLDAAFVDKLFNALEYQYKYKWHDLKKNPNDLPSKEGLYLVAYVEDCGIDFQIDLGYYEEAFGYGYGWHNYFYGNIIAWKEIEPFLTT